MNKRRNPFIIPALLAVGIGTYVLVAGTNGSCATCSAVTRAIGLGDGTAHLADRPPSDPDRPEAPSWRAADLSGGMVSSDEFAGQVTLIDFWATWCGPCVKMAPHLVDLQEEFEERGFTVIGMSLDQGGAPVVRRFNEQYGVNYPSLLASARIAEAFGGVRAIPTSFLIDRDGRIVSRHVGYVPLARLRAEIEPLL